MSAARRSVARYWQAWILPCVNCAPIVQFPAVDRFANSPMNSLCSGVWSPC
jgi:hypothetical protein